jgi:hypothetical protein
MCAHNQQLLLAVQDLYSSAVVAEAITQLILASAAAVMSGSVDVPLYVMLCSPLMLVSGPS